MGYTEGYVEHEREAITTPTLLSASASSTIISASEPSPLARIRPYSCFFKLDRTIHLLFLPCYKVPQISLFLLFFCFACVCASQRLSKIHAFSLSSSLSLGSFFLFCQKSSSECELALMSFTIESIIKGFSCMILVWGFLLLHLFFLNSVFSVIIVTCVYDWGILLALYFSFSPFFPGADCTALTPSRF